MVNFNKKIHGTFQAKEEEVAALTKQFEELKSQMEEAQRTITSQERRLEDASRSRSSASELRAEIQKLKVFFIEFHLVPLNTISCVGRVDSDPATEDFAGV